MDTYIQLDIQKTRVVKSNIISEDDIISSLPSEDDIKDILRNINYDNIPIPGWKFLDRVEPSISNIDKTQDLRLYTVSSSPFDIYHKIDDGIFITHYIKFYSTNKKISIEDLKIIANVLKIVVEEYLQYEINVFIIRKFDIE